MLLSNMHLLFFLCLVSIKNTCAHVQPAPSSNDFNKILTIGVPIMLFIIVIATFGIFILFMHWCWSLPLALSLGGGLATTNEFSKRQKGLDKSVLETLPILVYSKMKEHLIGKGSLDCAVCLTEFESDDMLRLLPSCNHVFHLGCIDAWLECQVTCPLCRGNLMPNIEAPVKIDCSTIRSDDAVVDGIVAARETNEENHEHSIVITVEHVIEMRSNDAISSLNYVTFNGAHATGYINRYVPKSRIVQTKASCEHGR